MKRKYLGRCNKSAIAFSKVNGFKACRECVNVMSDSDIDVMQSGFEYHATDADVYRCDTPLFEGP